MRIGEFARRTGLSRDTLRFYERRGLIRPSLSANGYRDYPPEMVDRVVQLRLAQSLGFSLAQIRALLQEWDADALTPARMRAVIDLQLSRVDAQLARLSHLQAYLRAKRAWIEGGQRGTPPVFGEEARCTVGDTAAPAASTRTRRRA